MNADGETGFSYIRIQTANGPAEGFIRSCYLELRVLDASVVALAAVDRGDVIQPMKPDSNRFQLHSNSSHCLRADAVQ